jgi:hypothetical protein
MVDRNERVDKNIVVQKAVAQKYSDSDIKSG